MTPLITRVAPSPTGDFHIGTARTAYHNYLAARATGGKFILRIDDTDLERSKPEYTQVILDTMEWLGLEYDELFYQSESDAHYKQTVKNMCTQEAIYLDDKGVTRLTQEYDGAHLAMMKADGTPAYHFASVVDDYMMRINYIIRGHDHLNNLPKQHLIHRCVGFKTPFPEVQHTSLITLKGKKISKRDNCASMLWYRDQGYNPDAMLNFMLRLGWSPKKEDKSHNIITKKRAIGMFFDEGAFSDKDLCGFDQAKLDWYDKKYKNMKKIAA
jgi:glutamyl-tRNA synthetase